MKIITMYTGPMCNFCEAAKRLFSRNNLKYQEIDISMKDGLRDEMIKKANGKRTIPQIYPTNIFRRSSCWRISRTKRIRKKR